MISMAVTDSALHGSLEGFYRRPDGTYIFDPNRATQPEPEPQPEPRPTASWRAPRAPRQHSHPTLSPEDRAFLLARPLDLTRSFNHVKRERYLSALRHGYRRVEAARLIDVFHSTVSDYCVNHPDFMDRVAEAEATACDVIEAAMWKSALAGNVIAQQVWLYNRSGGRWRDQRNVRVEVNLEAQAKLLAEKLGLDPDDLLERVEAIRQGKWYVVGGAPLQPPRDDEGVIEPEKVIEHVPDDQPA